MVEEKGNILDLEAKVVYNGLCCYCGACGAFCKEYITYEDEIPKLKEKCYELQGACYDFCPRTFFAPFEVEGEIFDAIREDNELGFYSGDILTARATDEKIRKKAQDGGIVSALLCLLLREGEIDAAVVAKTSAEDAWKPEPFVATKEVDIIAAAGSKYTQCPSVLGVGDAFESGYKDVAFVGLPCHIQAMRKIQLSKNFDVGIERVKMLIGLFCFETFDMPSLQIKLLNSGTRIEDVDKFNIKKGNFFVYPNPKKGKEIKVPIREMKECVKEACNYCYDFTAEFADISVGSIGSEIGWSTVICRSEGSKNLIKRAEEEGVIESRKLSEEEIESVRNLALRKKRENLKNIYAKMGPVKILNMLVEPEKLKEILL